MNQSLSFRYEYSQHTSIGSLRPHIGRCHLELYLTLAKKEGWKIPLPGFVPQAQSQVTNEATAAQGEQPDEL